MRMSLGEDKRGADGAELERRKYHCRCEVEDGTVGRVVEGVAGTTSEIKLHVLASVPVGVAVCYPKERFSSYLDKWALKIHHLGFGECEGRRKNIDALGIGGTRDDIRAEIEVEGGSLRWALGRSCSCVLA
jgi:hypothetical protein